MKNPYPKTLDGLCSGLNTFKGFTKIINSPIITKNEANIGKNQTGGRLTLIPRIYL
jgi:hypothetical protein